MNCEPTLKADLSKAQLRASREIEQMNRHAEFYSKRDEGGKDGPLTASCRCASMIYQRRLLKPSESSKHVGTDLYAPIGFCHLRLAPFQLWRIVIFLAPSFVLALILG